MLVGQDSDSEMSSDDDIDTDTEDTSSGDIEQNSEDGFWDAYPDLPIVGPEIECKHHKKHICYRETARGQRSSKHPRRSRATPSRRPEKDITAVVKKVVGSTFFGPFLAH